MTPWQYAGRYLSIDVPGTSAGPIRIDRYHRGDPTNQKDALQGLVKAEFERQSRKTSGFRLPVTVNGQRFEFRSYDDIKFCLQHPFIGKGAPEECQVVLQLAVATMLVKPENLQKWADANLGLDCNGFVGSYLLHEVAGKDWRSAATKAEVGPSQGIDEYEKHWCDAPVTDAAKFERGRTYLVMRVDDRGDVISRFSGGKVGHIAITEPSEMMDRSFISDSFGGLDLETARLGLYGKKALRSVESGGPWNGGPGVGKNWMMILGPAKVKNAFVVMRDKMHFRDTVRIAPLRSSPV